MFKQESEKKYYSIGEVTTILQVPAYQLRYLEKIIPNFTVAKIKNRRYYTKQNIELIRTKINNPPTISDSSDEATLIINQINTLIAKFQKYSSDIQHLLSK